MLENNELAEGSALFSFIDELEKAEETLRVRSIHIPFLRERMLELREAGERISEAFGGELRDTLDIPLSDIDEYPDEGDDDLLSQVDDVILHGKLDEAYILQKKMNARKSRIKVDLDQLANQDKGRAIIEELLAHARAFLSRTAKRYAA